MKFIKQNSSKTIWRYFAFTFFVNLHFFSAVLVPIYTNWAHISKFQILTLQSWFMLWIFILEVPTGVIADYFGRKYSLALGALVVAFGALIYGSFPSFPIFLLGEFLFAAAFSLMSGADDALLYDALKEEGREGEIKNLAGKAHAMQLTAMLISAPIGGFMAYVFGVNSPMLFCAVPFFIAALIAWTIKEPQIKEKVSESRRYLTIVKEGLSFFYHHKTLRLLALDAIVVAAGAYFVIWLYQPLLQSLSVPIVYFGLFHMIMALSEIIIASYFVQLEKWFGGAKRFLRFGALITSIMFFVVAIFPNIFTVIVFVVLAGGFGLTRLELMTAYMNKLIPSEQRATILSSISMFRRFALVFLNPVVGFIADKSLGWALLFVGIFPLLIFFFSPLKKEMFD